MSKWWSVASLVSGGLVRTRGPTKQSSVYLTFDDGPHPEHTVRLLDLLAQHDAKGTFFLVGEAADRAPEIVHRMLAEGHAIASHSMTHPKMRALSAGAQWAEINGADEVLQRFDGRRRHAFRPPNGRVTAAVLAASLWRLQPLVLWTIDSLDFKLSPADVVQRLTTAALTGGDIVLFHDDSACASHALETLLPLWKKDGHRFSALELGARRRDGAGAQ